MTTVLLLLAMLATGRPKPDPTPLLLVVNQGDATLSLIDPRTNTVLHTIAEDVPANVGHEVATSPDGRRAFLPLYGNAGVGKPGTDGRTLLVIDLLDHKIIDKLDFGHGVRPHCILYDHRRNLLYVTTELDQTITIIDPKTRQIVASVPTHQEQSHMLAISHNGRFGYTANVGPGTVSVLDLDKRAFITTIPIAPSTQRISISNDDTMVFTADQTRPRLAVIDAHTNTISTWIDLPSIGYGSASTLDGKHLLVTLPSAGELAIVDLATLKVIQTIKIGPRPQEVLIRPDGRTAYVSCFGGKQVVAIAIPSWTVDSTVEAGEKADGMAWAVSPKPQ